MPENSPGRPRKTEDEKREIKLQVRVTKDESDLFEECATTSHRTMSSWILHACHQQAKAQRAVRPARKTKKR